VDDRLRELERQAWTSNDTDVVLAFARACERAGTPVPRDVLMVCDPHRLADAGRLDFVAARAVAGFAAFQTGGRQRAAEILSRHRKAGFNWATCWQQVRDEENDLRRGGGIPSSVRKLVVAAMGVHVKRQRVILRLVTVTTGTIRMVTVDPQGRNVSKVRGMTMYRGKGDLKRRLCGHRVARYVAEAFGNIDHEADLVRATLDRGYVGVAAA